MGEAVVRGTAVFGASTLALVRAWKKHTWNFCVSTIVTHAGTNRLVTLLLFLSVQYKTCKDGSVLGVTVMRIAMLTHCQAITQSCSYTEGSTHIYSCWLNLWTALLSCYGRLFLSDAQMLKFDLLCFCFSAETIVNVLDFKKDVGLWHAIQTVRKLLYETTIPRR